MDWVCCSLHRKLENYYTWEKKLCRLCLSNGADVCLSSFGMFSYYLGFEGQSFAMIIGFGGGK